MVDIHIHTEFSADSRERPDNYIEAAREKNNSAVGFSDHCDYDMFLAGDKSSILDADSYFKRLSSLENNAHGIKILKGVELGYAVGTEEYYKRLLSAYPFDYAVISVHGVPERGDCYYPKYFDGLDKHAAFELYLNAVLNSVLSDIDFKVLGHLGYIARYAPYDDKRLVYSDFPALLDKILRAVIDRGAALELNTSCRGMNAVCITDTSILDRYIALGGKYFSFGSDAHASDRYADKSAELIDLLKSLGVGFTVHFENGKIIKDVF